MGYAGGEKENPTYRSLGQHTETLQLDFNPERVSFKELLDVFWNSHSPFTQSISRQYISIIFFHNEEQELAARESIAIQNKKHNRIVVTELVPLSRFYQAEDYHQKYYLQGNAQLMKDFKALYTNFQEFVDSTAATRVNGYLGGYGYEHDLIREIKELAQSAVKS